MIVKIDENIIFLIDFFINKTYRHSPGVKRKKTKHRTEILKKYITLAGFLIVILTFDLVILL